MLPSGKLTWQWKMDLLKMYSLLKMVIFHCYVSLLEGSFREKKRRFRNLKLTQLFSWKSSEPVTCIERCVPVIGKMLGAPWVEGPVP